MDRKEMKVNSRVIITVTAIVLFAVAVLFTVFIFLSDDKSGTITIPQPSEEVAAEIEKYRKTADENGMTVVDMDSQPYFLEKQKGAEYSDAETITYYSDVAKKERKASVLLPKDYNPERKYPVLYLLHGLGGSHRTWLNKDADIIVQNMRYFENVPAMIVVFPDCAVNAEDLDENENITEVISGFDLTERELTESLMPYIEKHYSVSTEKKDTSIAGNSMGGRNSLYTAFTNQTRFGYIGAFSSAKTIESGRTSMMKPLLDDFIIEPGSEGFKNILVCVGRQDNICGNESYVIDKRLTRNGIRHIFYDMDGGHDNAVWQNALYNFLKIIFKN